MTWLPYIGIGITLGSALVLIDAFFLAREATLVKSGPFFGFNPARAREDINRALGGRLAASLLSLGVVVSLIAPPGTAVPDPSVRSGGGASAALLVGLTIAVVWTQVRPVLFRRSARRISENEPIEGASSARIFALLMDEDSPSDDTAA